MDVKILYEGKFRRFVNRDGWEFVERIRSQEVVVMIPVTDDGRLVFVEQYRVPVGRQMIEFPAGLVNDLDTNQHESLEDTARRELIEETGYDASQMRFIFRGPANSALATDMLTVYMARGLAKVGPGGGDATENIQVHEVPLKEVDLWLENQIRSGKYVDLKVYSGLYYLMKKSTQGDSGGV